MLEFPKKSFSIIIITKPNTLSENNPRNCIKLWGTPRRISKDIYLAAHTRGCLCRKERLNPTPPHPLFGSTGFPSFLGERGVVAQEENEFGVGGRGGGSVFVGCAGMQDVLRGVVVATIRDEKIWCLAEKKLLNLGVECAVGKKDVVSWKNLEV